MSADNNTGKLTADPYNLIITGVGGQGNVLASRMVGSMMTDLGFHITIGETFGASQRGGSVMSHLRITEKGTVSPQIPRNKAHLVIALEPSEAFRVLAVYGNPGTKVIWNTRPIYPASVNTGEVKYPDRQAITEGLARITAAQWAVAATDKALELGNPILGNVMLVGSLVGLKVLPFTRTDFARTLSATMPAAKVDINLKAFDLGAAAVAED